MGQSCLVRFFYGAYMGLGQVGLGAWRQRWGLMLLFYSPVDFLELTIFPGIEAGSRVTIPFWVIRYYLKFLVSGNKHILLDI